MDSPGRSGKQGHQGGVPFCVLAIVESNAYRFFFDGKATYFGEIKMAMREFLLNRHKFSSTTRMFYSCDKCFMYFCARRTELIVI